jgi:Concanavalin A-like lectin/glucanases superfamily
VFAHRCDPGPCPVDDAPHTTCTAPVVPTYAERVKADGAAHFWRLNEPSGSRATDSIGGAHGTISGGVQLGARGAIGDGDAAMSFDGGLTERVVVPAGAIPSWGMRSTSVELWCRASALPPDPYAYGPLEAIGSNTWQFVSSYIGGDDTFYCDVGWGVENEYAPLHCAFGGAGLWHHIVVVLDRAAGTVELFRDGVSRVSIPVPSEAVFDLDGDWNVGNMTTLTQSNDPTWAGWLGEVDDVAIYNRALTAQQVAAHYVAGRAVKSYADMVQRDGASHFWRLNESEGQQAADSVGDAHGLISSGVTHGAKGAINDHDAAMSFDGTTGRVAVPHGAYMDEWSNKSFSIEAWIFARSFPTMAGSAAAIVDMQSSVDPFSIPGGTACYFWADDGLIYFDVTSLTPQYFYAGAPNPLTLGVWHHLVCVLNRAAGSMQVFLDGTAGPTVEDAVMSPDEDLTVSPDAALEVGHWNFTTPAYFGWDGAIDDVAIYPRALTAAEVAAHFAAATATLPTTAPVAAPVKVLPPVEFTTKSYRRELHGPRRRA